MARQRPCNSITRTASAIHVPGSMDSSLRIQHQVPWGCTKCADRNWNYSNGSKICACNSLGANSGFLAWKSMPLLSENTNLRKDAYGGSAWARAKLAVDIVGAVHNTTPDSSCLGILVGAVDSDGK